MAAHVRRMQSLTRPCIDRGSGPGTVSFDASEVRSTVRLRVSSRAEPNERSFDSGGSPSPLAGGGGDLSTAASGIEVRQGGLGSPAQAAALATLCAVLFLTFLDNTVVSVGLADIQSTLHAGVISLQWVVDGYALTFATFMLAAGTMGDILGRKKAMLAGVAGFVGSWCWSSAMKSLMKSVGVSSWLLRRVALAVLCPAACADVVVMIGMVIWHLRS
jgi:hypothetical protein